MSWLGKVIGSAFGFLVGGPVGAFMGAALGHQFDQRSGVENPFLAEAESPDQYRLQMTFFTALFSVMGHIAKADGRVNEAEIKLARQVMDRLQLNPQMRKSAISLFNEGKREDFPLDETLDGLRAECRSRFSLIRLFVELQIELALADGALHAAEEGLLFKICKKLRFSRFELHALKAALEAQIKFAGGNWREHRQPVGRREPTLEESYAVLGLESSAGDEDIRRAYRRLLSRHHPDKLAAKGMPEESLRLANEKTHEIRRAWDIIRKSRKL